MTRRSRTSTLAADRQRGSRAAWAHGLALVDEDEVEYGSVTSSFPDSAARLIVRTRDAQRTAALLQSSGLRVRRPEAPRSTSDAHGPPPGVTLLTAQTDLTDVGVRCRDDCSATWAVHDPTRLFVSVGEI